MKIKRILSTVTAVAMAVCMLPNMGMTAHAAGYSDHSFMLVCEGGHTTVITEFPPEFDASTVLSNGCYCGESFADWAWCSGNPDSIAEWCPICNPPAVVVESTPEPTPEPEPVPVVIDETKLPVEIVKKDKTDVHNVIAADVTEEAYNLSQFTTIKGFAYGIETAVKYEQKKNETAAVKSNEVEVYTGYAYTFGKSCVDVLKNSNVDIVYIFMHKGQLFKVTIPAGTDIESLLDENGFAGPLWIGMQLGTTVLLK